MATKRQRMAIVTVTGEPKLSLPQFLGTLPAVGGGGQDGRSLASDAECYLAYCYLCRTGASLPVRSRGGCKPALAQCALTSLSRLAGLWDDLAPRVSRCGTLYFLCTPSTTVLAPPAEVTPAQRHTRRRREAGPAATAAAPVPDAPAAPGEGGDAQVEVRDGGGDSSLDVDGDGDGEGGSDEDAAGGVPALGHTPHAAPAAAAAAAAAGQTAEEAAAQRVVTLIVPVSISTAAPTPDRLHQLLALSDVEGGAPVSMALVDSDCTCIVSNIYRGMVPPPALDVVDGEGVPDDDDDLPAPVEHAGGRVEQEQQVDGGDGAEGGDVQDEPME